jgi:pimeloyl-[acyl-carrier protein] methyl ester esterase
MSTKWILQHGWGFDSFCWTSWLQSFSSDISLNLIDRGYFVNTPLTSQKDDCQLTGKHNVAVVHSLGLHLLPESIYQHVDGLVIIAGFISFNDKVKPDDSVIEAMLQKLPENASEVLKRFYRRCGCVSELFESPLVINHARLIQDLTLLNSHCFDIRQIAHIPKIVVLHGAADKIVPVEKSVELQQQLPHSKLFVSKDAGHALPFTHSDWCFQIINEEMALSRTGGVHE